MALLRGCLRGGGAAVTLADLAPGDMCTLATGERVRVRWHAGRVSFVGAVGEPPRPLDASALVTHVEKPRRASANGEVCDPVLSRGADHGVLWRR